MIDRRLFAICITVLLALVILIGGMTTGRVLNRPDIGFRNPLAVGADGCGSALTAATLNACITAIGAATETLMITPGTWAINANVTVPANVELWVASGAILSVSSGMTLTINGSLRAPDTQIFSTAGTGNIRFGPRHSSVKAVWYGIVCDNSTDNLTAITRMQASLTDGMRADWPYGICKTSPATITQRGITWRGAGYAGTGATGGTGEGTKLRAIGSQTHVLRIINQAIRIEDMAFDGNFLTSTAVVFIESAGSTSPSNIILERILVERTLPDVGALVQLGGDTNLQVDYVHLRNSWLIQDSAGGGTKAAYGVLVKNTNTFLNKGELLIISGARVGVEWRAASMDLYTVQVEGATTANFQVNLNTQPLKIVSCYSETPNVPMFRWLSPINPNPNTIQIEQCQFNSTSQSVADWYILQPTILIGNKLNANSWTVDLAGGGNDKYRIFAIGTTTIGAGIGFGGDGLFAVDEVNTHNDNGAGVITSISTNRSSWSFNNARIGTIGFTFPLASLTGFVSGTEAWDPVNLSPGGIETRVVNVAGALVTDHCLATLDTLTNQQAQLTCKVQTTGQVFVLLKNAGTVGDINLGSGTLRLTLLSVTNP